MKRFSAATLVVLLLTVFARSAGAGYVAEWDARAAETASQELSGALDFLGSVSAAVANAETAQQLDMDVARLRELAQQLSQGLSSGKGRPETHSLFDQIVVQGESIRRSMGTVHVAPSDERLEKFQRAMQVLSWYYRTE